MNEISRITRTTGLKPRC